MVSLAEYQIALFYGKRGVVLGGMVMKIIQVCLTVLCVGGLLAGALVGCNDKTPIVVGFSGGLTGRHAALGIDGRAGVGFCDPAWC